MKRLVSYISLFMVLCFLSINGINAISKDDINISVVQYNDGEKQLTNGGMTIFNNLNEEKSNLKNGEIAIDITVNNPTETDETGIAVQITFDTEVLENFEITSINASTGEASFSTNEKDIMWYIYTSPKKQQVTLSYILKLKSNVSDSILNKNINTNRQIIVNQMGRNLGTYPTLEELEKAPCSPIIKLNKKVNPVGELTVRKTVTGEGANLDKSFTFKVTLNNKLNGSYGNMTFSEGVSTFSLKNNQSMTARNLPVGTTYSVIEVEENQNHYETTKTNENGSIKEGNTEVSFVNNYVMPRGNLTIKKVVSGSGADINKTFNITVTLSDTSISGQYGDVNFTKGVAIFTIKNDETKNINNLPAEITYTVEETEANQNGYITIFDNGNGNKNSLKATGTITESTTKNVVITNSKENDKFIVFNKQFDTTTNFNEDVKINPNTFSGSYQFVPGSLNGKSVVINASNGSTSISFTVKFENDTITIPSKYASTYTDYSFIYPDSSYKASFKIEKEIPQIPESLTFHLTDNNDYNEDVTLTKSENYIKTIQNKIKDISKITITESGDGNWNFTYRTNENDGNITVFLENKGGSYKVSGSVEEIVESKTLTIEKVWDYLDNYITISYNSFSGILNKEVKVVDKNGKVFETVLLDNEGHGITKNKYKNSDEIYIEYPDGKRVKVESDNPTLPDEITVKINGKTYILSKENDYKMTVTTDIEGEVNVEEVSVISGFVSSYSQTSEGNNYKVTVTNTYLTNRSVNYNEPETPVENPDTGLNSYFKVGFMIIIVSITAYVLIKRKSNF